MTTDSLSGAPEGGPGNAALRWAADVLGCADVAVVRGLREGGAPWLLQAGDRAAILKDGTPDQAAQFATEDAHER